MSQYVLCTIGLQTQIITEKMCLCTTRLKTQILTQMSACGMYC